MASSAEDSRAGQRPRFKSSASGTLAEQKGLRWSVATIIHSPTFDSTMAVIILLNFVLIVVEADKSVQADSTAAMPTWVLTSGGWVILLIFVIELVLRLIVERGGFFTDGWNCFDFAVIAIDALLSVFGVIFGDNFPISAIRILRLCKLARVSKVFRVFPELRIMMAGLIGSMRAIFWGMVLLFFALLMFAVIAVQFIHPLNVQLHESGYYEKTGCERCPHAYSSVARAVLTLLEQNVAGESWTMLIIPIIEAYPVSAIYFLAVLMVIGMAVLNLILGVVVNVAMEARDKLLLEIGKEKVVQRMQAEQNLIDICEELDLDQNGALDKHELQQGYRNNDRFRESLNGLNIFEEDLEILWLILDPSADGKINYADFISRSYSMKESDTEFILAYIKYHVTVMQNQLLVALGNLADEEKKLEQLVDTMEKEEEKIEHSMEEIHDALLSQSVEGKRSSADPVERKTTTTDSYFSKVGHCKLTPEIDQSFLCELMDRTQQLRETMSVSLSSIHAELALRSQAPTKRTMSYNEKDGAECQSRIESLTAPSVFHM